MNNETTVIESLTVLGDIVKILEQLSIPYFLTGSLASSARGEFRATNDIDIVADLDEKLAQQLVLKAAQLFFVDPLAVANAVRIKGCFNLIHEETMLKVDIFTNIEALQQDQLSRATSVRLPGLNVAVKIATAEDIILSKLVWYRKGGSVSERQWGDILGVLSVSGETLDYQYLNAWAAELQLTESLAKALGKGVRSHTQE